MAYAHGSLLVGLSFEIQSIKLYFFTETPKSSSVLTGVWWIDPIMCTIETS